MGLVTAVVRPEALAIKRGNPVVSRAVQTIGQVALMTEHRAAPIDRLVPNDVPSTIVDLNERRAARELLTRHDE